MKKPHRFAASFHNKADMGISGAAFGPGQRPRAQDVEIEAASGIARTVVMSAQHPPVHPGANEISAENVTSLLVVDSFPPLGLMPNDGVLHTNALRNALISLLDSMFEVQSVLHQRDALEVAVVSIEGGIQPTEHCVRVMHLIESSALRDARNKHSAIGRIRFALKGGRLFQGSTDCQVYARTMFAEVCSYAKGFASSRNASKVNVTVVTSCSVAGHWKDWMASGIKDFGSIGITMYTRFFALSPSTEAFFPDASEGQCGKHFDYYEIPSYTASISWALRSVLGDSLESRACLKICGAEGQQMFCMRLAVRPRVLCTLGSALLYNARVCLPEYITLDAVQRVCAQSLNEDVLLGVPHVVSACMADGAGRLQLKKLIQALQKGNELLLVWIDASGAFQARFGVLVPSRKTGCDVLLLREVACAQSIVPLGIWSGGKDDGRGPCWGDEDADKAALSVVQARFAPPVRRNGT